MTIENHHGQPKADGNIALTTADLPVNSIPGDITEIEYESALEATRGPSLTGKPERRPGILTRTGRHFRNCVIQIPRHPIQRLSEKGSIT